MNLPGRLRSSTLGDLLGTLHRGRVSGVLTLREGCGLGSAKLHRIYLRAGLVVTIETTREGEPRASRALPVMPHRERLERLERLFQLQDADITFHVADQRLDGVSALLPAEFLHGRPRARDRAGSPQNRRRAQRVSVEPESPTAEPPLVMLRRRALATLGLAPGASVSDVQRAFKLLALRLHPDRHPGADAREREKLCANFARLTQAYHLLIA